VAFVCTGWTGASTTGTKQSALVCGSKIKRFHKHDPPLPPPGGAHHPYALVTLPNVTAPCFWQLQVGGQMSAGL